MATEVFQGMSDRDHEQVVFCSDPASGLLAIIAIHNTTLGPALGGTRMWTYDTEAEALQVIEAIVTAFTDAMAEHHAASQYPPVRGMPPTPDPLDNPFADLEDPGMWEVTR